MLSFLIVSGVCLKNINDERYQQTCAFVNAFIDYTSYISAFIRNKISEIFTDYTGMLCNARLEYSRRRSDGESIFRECKGEEFIERIFSDPLVAVEENINVLCELPQQLSA